jgi:hypothetical protein
MDVKFILSICLLSYCTTTVPTIVPCSTVLSGQLFVKCILIWLNNNHFGAECQCNAFVVLNFHYDLFVGVDFCAIMENIVGTFGYVFLLQSCELSIELKFFYSY